jgi:signal transduction histidine kinase
LNEATLFGPAMHEPSPARKETGCDAAQVCLVMSNEIAQADGGSQVEAEQAALEGCFGTPELVPLLTDLISRGLLQIIIHGYQQEAGCPANIVQNDGIIIRVRERGEDIAEYFRKLLNLPWSIRKKRLSECERARITELIERNLPVLDYMCGEGLCSFVAPICVKPTEDAPPGTGMVIAAFVGGQTVVSGEEAEREKIMSFAEGCDLPPDELWEAYCRIEPISQEMHARNRARLTEIADEVTRLATHEYHRIQHERGNKVYQSVSECLEDVFYRSVLPEKKTPDDSFLWQQIAQLLPEITNAFGFDAAVVFAENEQTKSGKRAAARYLVPRLAYGGPRKGINMTPGGKTRVPIDKGPILSQAQRRRTRRLIRAHRDEYYLDPLISSMNDLVDRPLTDYDVYFAFPAGTATFSGTLAALRDLSRHTRLFHSIVDPDSERIISLIVRDFSTTFEVISTIAKLEQAQAEIRENLRALEKLQKNRQTLVTVIAHQIMAPIHTAEMYIALMQKGTEKLDPDKLRKHLEIVARQTAILEHRVRSFINYTKTLDTGIAKQLFGKSPWQKGTDKINLLQLVEEVVREIGSFAEANRQQLVISHKQTPGREFPTITGSYDEIRDVVINLIHNAIKYSAPGTKIVLRFELRRGEVALLVESIGIPVEPKDKERIFEFSYRTEAARAMRTAGTGIGLSIARSIVENHGGTIRLADSTFFARRDGQTLNRNTFEVTLPT